MLVKVAWRNVWRHKTRSSVIIISVVFGIWAGLFIQSFMNGITEERVRTAIETEISHIQIHHPEFKKDYDAKFIIDSAAAVLETIKHIRQIKAATGRVIAKGMIATASGSAGIKINGVDVVEEDSTAHLSKNITEGSYFSAGSKNEMIIGQKLLQKLKLKLHSKVVITLLDKDNNIISGAFRIQGIFKTQNTPFDEGNIFVKREALAFLLNIDDGIHEIAILLYSNASLDSVCRRIKINYPAVKTETWNEISPEIDMIVSTAQQSMLIYMSIVMLALAFGIINTMLMAVLERTREIGMLMALGLNKSRVFIMILLETFFLVFTGTPIGMLLGVLTTAYFGKHGIDMSVYKDVYASFGYSEIIYTKLNAQDFYTVILLVLATSFISALFPARKALSLNPSEAIRK